MEEKQHFDNVISEFYPETDKEILGKYKERILDKNGEIYVGFGEDLSDSEQIEQGKEINKLQSELKRMETGERETDKKETVTKKTEPSIAEENFNKVIEYIENQRL